LERRADGEPALRLGFRMVKGLSEVAARRVLEARAVRTFTSTQDLAARAALDRRDLGALANAGALADFAGHRHRAAWSVAGVEAPLPLIAGVEIVEGIPLLRAPTEGQDIVADYRSVGLTLGRHPLALLRTRLARDGILTAAELWQLDDGATARAAGLVITRQRPMTASGVTFVTLEDETGHINLVVWLQVAERQRRVFLESRLLEVSGKLQRQDDVLHVIVTGMRDRTRLLGNLDARSRDFH
ncbi:MAG: OB-fold nucleic acid binding domain-containing protein, partial [Steroidobacteraceae bacterium]